MRRGEITVLDWKHLDNRNNVLFIGFSLNIIEGGVILCGTKTKDDRKIYIDQETVDILLKWRTLQTMVLGASENMFSNTDGKRIVISMPSYKLGKYIESYNRCEEN